MRILIVDDDNASRLMLRKTLKSMAYEVTESVNGLNAWDLIQQFRFDIILTDWMMPGLDGLELVHRIRERINPAPLLLMITSLASAEARVEALDSGADGFIGKPYHPDFVLSAIQQALNLQAQGSARGTCSVGQRRMSQPPFVGVGIAASTGGPSTVRRVIAGIVPTQLAAIFIVQHAPAWMLEAFVGRLQEDTTMKVRLAEHNMPVRPGEIYLAPGDKHMVIGQTDITIELDDGPPENFVRPAADPLFRSIARTFGSKCIAAVLTGMGRDGTIGSGYIAVNKGVVIAQDPGTAILPSMPQSVVDLGLAGIVRPAEEIGRVISEEVDRLSGNTKSLFGMSQQTRSRELKKTSSCV
jgi:two-component system, chemotaxis family, protein-glutamate methylesterase/glutaminase